MSVLFACFPFILNAAGALLCPFSGRWLDCIGLSPAGTPHTFTLIWGSVCKA
ncbi:hypothetical protein LZ31DRAFT_554031 [Colletotrichum somersetense]|nr:hypothetical protein LZ31DRAFT_554031 [Colletotrichum somersetense]